VKVVFLDRDGVINRDRADYVKNTSEFEFLPGAKEALRRLTESGYTVVVISNQQGVGKGLISPETLAEIDRKLRDEVAEAGGRIDAAYYCPHLAEENCGCRKPATGLIERASRDLGISPDSAVMVGDSARDVEAGRRARCYVIAVLSGSLSASDIEKLAVKPDEVARDLADAVDRILAREEGSKGVS